MDLLEPSQELYAQAAKDRQHARELLVGRHRLGARPRRLSAHVDQIGPVRFHAKRRIDGRCRIQTRRALAEGVGRDVEDAHHEASLAQTKRPLAGKRNGVVAAERVDHVIKN